MMLDLSSLASAEGGNLPVSVETGFEDVCFCGVEFSFPESVSISGEITHSSGQYMLVGKVVGKVTSDCARCGKPVTESFEFDLTEKLIKDDGVRADEDAVYFEGHSIDVTELALNAFFMNAPVKFLCKEDCKGLCPKCGKDLNKGDCGCDTDGGDPRFDILNQIKF